MFKEKIPKQKKKLIRNQLDLAGKTLYIRQ